jgi:hypothetical protein
MHKKHANRQVLKVGVVVVALVVLVAVLFSLTSDREVVAGQAIALTGDNVDVVDSERVTNPQNGLAGDRSASSQGQFGDENLRCPSGFVSDAENSRYCQGNFNNQLLSIGGWIILRPKIDMTITSIGLNHVLSNQCQNDECRKLNGDSVSTRIFVSENENGGNWIFLGEIISDELQVSKTDILAVTNFDVQTILIARGGTGPAARNPNWFFLELDGVPVSCQPNGVISENDDSDEIICFNGGLIPVNQGCTPGESYAGRAYCDDGTWTDNGEEVRSRFIFPDGTQTQRTPETGFCQNDNFCIATGGTRCYENGFAFPNNICQRGTWISCDRTSDNGEILDDNYICINRQWREGLACASEGEVIGNAFCNGNEFTSCDDVANIACVRDGRDGTEICNVQNVNNLANDGEEFYCTADEQWIECNEETLGQGVENVNPTEPYAHNFVCVRDVFSENSFFWKQINCQACIGDRPGICTGSKTLDISTSLTVDALSYYHSDREELIGCAAQSECYFDDTDATTSNSYAVDEKVGVLNDDAVCGLNSNWLRCIPSSTERFVVSDGGAELCTASGDWETCSATQNSNQQRGDYQCTQIDGEWQWFSQLVCSENGKYKVRNSETEICDGSAWISCPEAEETLTENEGVSVVCNNDGTIEVNELICNDDEDNDNNGLIDCRDIPACTESRGKTLHQFNYYTITLKSDDCFQEDIHQFADGVRNANNLRLRYDGIRVDERNDEGLQRNLDQVTLRSDNLGRFTIDSVTSLRNSNRRPQESQTFGGITFLYQRSTTSVKQVDVILTLDVDTQEQVFPLSVFTTNMLNGQKVFLKVDGEYYLLSYPDGEEFFTLENLQLRHLPLDREFPGEIFSGTGEMVFDIFSNREIVVTTSQGFVRISSQLALERPEAFAVPGNLQENLEVVITKATPIRITNPNLGELTICRQDNDADPRQALLCRNADGQGEADLIATLTNNVMATITLDGNDYALLYEVVDGTKQISIFNLIRPSITSVENLVYNDFINGMVAGRRVAVEFENELYLISHTVQNSFSLLELSVTRHADGVTIFPVVGSEDLVEVSVLGGKLTIERDYGTPPPPFRVSGMNARQLLDNPVNLLEQFSTTMSSVLPVNIGQPTNFGVITASDQDFTLLRQTFRLQADSYTFAIPLNFDEPRETTNGDVLMLYDSAEITGQIPVKIVKFYLLYDVADNVRRNFNDDFIRQLTSGREIALQIGNSYYLLGYRGVTSSEVTFFDMENLRISSLDKTRVIEPTVTGVQAVFDTPNGLVIVELDQINREIIFRTTTQVELLTQDAFGAYARQLTVSNKVELDGATGLVLDICNEALNSVTTLADICFNVPHQGRQNFFVDEGSPQLLQVDGVNYLLEVNGRTGADKVVLVRRIINIDNPRLSSQGIVLPASARHLEDNWVNFVANVTTDTYPIFNISGEFYVPRAVGRELNQFSFRSFSGLGRSGLRNSNAITQVLMNGTYTLGENVLRATQSLTGELRDRQIQTEFALQNYYYLPDDRTPLFLNLSSDGGFIVFNVNIDDKFYYLTARPETSELIRVNLFETDAFVSNIESSRILLQNRYLGEGDSRVIRVGSDRFEIKIAKIKAEDSSQNVIEFAHLTIERK